jgi:parallel beta-helix repeat protein
MKLDSCVITADGDPYHPVFSMTTAGGPNYIFIDGFEIAASSEAYEGIGVKISNINSGASTSGAAPHHIWIINNIIHGYGEGGVVADEADWLFILHNHVYNNAYATCDAQGSGIDLVVAKATPDYTPTANDLTWAPFHQVIGWNAVHGNFVKSCGTAASAYNTDGNGIILDTFNGSNAGDIVFPEQSLVAYNITFMNGGKGIHVFRSSYITVANNTAFDNNLDPFNPGIARGEFENSGGFNNTWINNIARPVPATSAADPRCQGVTNNPQPDPCPLMANAAFFGGDGGGVVDENNSWRHNINLGGTPPYGWGPSGNVMLGNDTSAFTCKTNKCQVSPRLAKVGTGNFALVAGSPAIGYGLTKSGLTSYEVDAGACYHTLTTCP